MFTVTTLGNTDTVSEGTSNLYHTDARARGAISVSGNALSYNSSTGVITSAYEEAPVFTGNVGMGGETSPDEALVINGGVKIKGTNYLSFSNTSDQTYIRAAASNELAFGTDSTERLRIDSDGKVLIGHTAAVPIRTIEQRVQISGVDQATSGLSLARYQNGAFAPGIHLAKSRNATVGSHTIVQDGDRLGDITFYGSDGTDFANHSAAIMAHIDGTPGANDTPGRLSFHTTADGSGSATERMRIDSSGDITMSSTGSMTIPSGTTAQRPASPTAGMVRFNTTLDYVEYYNGDGWFATDTTGVAASGGTETTVGGYKIHTFTSSGTFTVTSGGAIEYLVIAGGGGGGSGTAGGGGAGGYRTNVSGATSGGGASAEGTFSVTPQAYTITVGAGGAGGVVSTNLPASGSNSTALGITSIGGGAGGEGNPNNSFTNGLNGGSGGGSWQYSSNSGTAGSGTTGQGYAGGASPNNGGSGGGGAGAVGVAASTGYPNGGAGVSSSITGSAVVRGGGGGGGKNPTAGVGGAGGGGNGNASNGATTAGAANTGGGGGAGYSHASGNGSNGGSGIVIIRYEV
jgi:hypothetical protein